MSNFNNQFATQKLREETNTFYVKYNKGYGKGEGIAKEFNSRKEAEEYAKRMNDISSGISFPTQKYYYVVDPNEKEVKETSMTGTGAGMTPSTVNNPTTQDWYTTKNKKKVKKEEKDVEPKLAAGKAKNYVKDKWGWEDAESIPNRPSKGGFIYKQLFEELNESYSKFKNQTKTRGKSDQFHQAVRQVKQKVQEINRLFEYVSRLKSELSEGEGGLKYKMHTEKALGKIKEMVAELNQSIKKFK